MNDAYKIIENGFVFTGEASDRAGWFSILIRGDRIVEVSTRGDLFKSLHPGAEVVDASRKVIFPGFIDAHMHGESFLLRRFTTGVPMSRWSREPSISRAMKFFDEESSLTDLTSAYRLAYTAAIKSGFTGLSEFGLDRLDLSLMASLEAFRTAELRGWLGLHNGDQIDRARTIKNASVRFTLPVPLEDDLTTYNLQSTVRTARDLQLPLVIHLGETRTGLETVKRNFRKSIIQFLDEYKVFSLPLHLTHLAAMDPEDLDVLGTKKCILIVSPRSAGQKYAEIPPFDELFRRGILLALGSDWGVPDPFENLRSMMATVDGLRLTAISPFSVLAMQTRNAATALGVVSDCGSIEAGKKADLTFVDVRDHRLGPALSGDHGAYLGVLLEELSGRDVTEVMVDGEFYVRESHFLTYAEEDLQREQQELLEKLTPYGVYSGRAMNIHTTPAPVIPLTPRPAAEEDTPGDSPDGFRIIRTGTKEPAVRPVPKPKEQADPHPVRRNIKKVFGEEEDPL